MPKIKVPASIEHLEKIIEFVSGSAKKEGFAGEKIKKIKLATEEAVVNILNYAYPEGSGEVEVSCSLVDDKKFIIEISDNGAPFNPLAVPEPDLTADIANRHVGGLGVFFIKKMADETNYHRNGAYNILNLMFFK